MNPKRDEDSLADILRVRMGVQPTHHYILGANREVLPATLREWSAMLERPRGRLVGRTSVGEATISTVFLGLDHSYGLIPPLLFETMVFDAPDGDDHMERYPTWAEAEAGHKATVAKIAKLSSSSG